MSKISCKKKQVKFSRSKIYQHTTCIANYNKICDQKIAAKNSGAEYFEDRFENLRNEYLSKKFREYKILLVLLEE
jgi:hypothetical protein